MVDRKLLPKLEADDSWKALYGSKGPTASVYYKQLMEGAFDRYRRWHNHSLEEPSLNRQAQNLCNALHKTLPEFVENYCNVDGSIGNQLLIHLAKRDGYKEALKHFQKPTDHDTKFQLNLQIFEHQLGKQAEQERAKTQGQSGF